MREQAPEVRVTNFKEVPIGYSELKARLGGPEARDEREEEYEGDGEEKNRSLHEDSDERRGRATAGVGRRTVA